LHVVAEQRPPHLAGRLGGRVSASGAGGNVVAVVPEHDLVVVTRWAGDPASVVNRVIEAIA